MARQILKPPSGGFSVPRSADPFTIQLSEERKDQLMEVRNESGVPWADWYEKGVDLLSEETHKELVSLLTTVPPAVSSQPRITFRAYPKDIERSTKIAASVGVPVRNVHIMALTLRMLWVPDAED